MSSSSPSECGLQLLPWLQSGSEEMMTAALEQLCEALLGAQAEDRPLLSTHPPSVYVPLLACLCQDPDLSISLTEVVVRSLTYYLQAVPHEVVSCLVASRGALASLCLRLEATDIHRSEHSDLTQQIVKLFEELCKRDTKSLSMIGGASYIINFMSKTYRMLHLDTIKSGLYILYKIIDRIDPNDKRLSEWFEFLSKFLKNIDNRIVEYSLHCLLTIIKMCNEKKISTEHFGIERIVDDLLEMIALQLKMDNEKSDSLTNPNDSLSPTSNSKICLSRTIIDLILCIVHGSTQFLCNLLVNNKLSEILTEIISKYDGASISVILLIEGIYDQINERITFHSKDYFTSFRIPPQLGFRMMHGRIYNDEMLVQHVRFHESLMKAVKGGNLSVLKELLLSTDFDPKFKDKWGQTVLNWASALGFTEAVNLLLARGINPNHGERASSFHYAAAQGHVAVLDTFMKNEGLDFAIKDCEGYTIIERMNQFRLSDSNDKRAFEMENLLLQIEKQCSEINPDVLVAKEYFVKRMTPILINLYFKNFKSSIRFTILELINKIVRSCNERDYDTLAKEYYQNYILPYHFAKLIYRVLLQDTGENVLEVIKLCHHLTTDKNHSKTFITWFCRMGVKDMMSKAIEKFANLYSEYNDVNVADKIIPLEVDAVFSQHKIDCHKLNISLNINQPYYWGDWNIMNDEEGINLYNEFCYIFICNNDSMKSLHVSILTRKSPEAGINPKNFIKNQLFNNFNTTKNLKNNNEENILINDLENVPNQSMICESGYEAVEIVEKNVFQRPDLVSQLLERYSLMMVSLQPIIMPVPFPKFVPRNMISIKHLIVSIFSNHLRIHYSNSFNGSLNMPVNLKSSDEIVEPPDFVEFTEISVNKISGCFVKSKNQILYATGPLILQEGFRRIETQKSISNTILKQQMIINPIKECICHRIILNGKHQLERLNSFEEVQTKFSKNVSNLINAFKIQKNIEKYLLNISKLFLSESTRPTPYELYKSQFLKILVEILQDELNVEKFVTAFEVNLPILTTMIIQLLEQIEDLPNSYQLHSFISDHYLTRALHVKTILKNCNDHGRFDTDPIPDLAKYTFLVMPLASPFSLKKSVFNLLQKLPWYRADKLSYNSIRQLSSPPYFIKLNSEGTENEGGFFNWLGTNGYRTKFINPLKLDLISLTTSENSSNLISNLCHLFLYQTDSKKNKQFKNYVSIQGPDAFLTVHLKYPLGLIPKQYTLGRPLIAESRIYSLINWRLMASVDGIVWDTLHIHENDTNLIESNTGKYTWSLNINPSLLHKVQNQGWTFFKIQEVFQNVDNFVELNNVSDEKIHNPTLINGFWLNYMEFYGIICAISETRQQEIQKNIETYLSKFKIGTLVHHTLDYYSSTNSSRITGKIIQPIKNGIVLVEWDNESGKSHVRHKMGSQNTYELMLSETINENMECASDFKPKTITESFVESKSSFDIHPVSRDDIRNSFQDSISWIVDPNMSVPLRTSSLSSQKNNRFSSFYNKENLIENITNKEVQNMFKKRKETTTDFQEFANFIKSETDYLDLRYENSDDENFQVESGTVKSNVQNKMEYLDGCSGGSKPTIQFNTKYPPEDYEKKSSKGREESKKNFSLSKETRRKAHLGLSEGRKDSLKIKDDIDMSDDSEFFELSQDPEKFLMQFQSLDNKNKIKPVLNKNYYSSFSRNYKYKHNFNDIGEANTKLKPVNVLQNFPGLVQPADPKLSQNVGQVRSNVEMINYRQPKSSSKADINSKTKSFGYDTKQFRMKFEIQMPAAIKTNFDFQQYIDSKKTESNMEDYFTAEKKKPEKTLTSKRTYEFLLNNDSHYPIVSNILCMLPLPDPINNSYPIESISQIWHNQFTLYYGFCDKKTLGNSCKNCFYQKKTDQKTKDDSKNSEDLLLIINVLNLLKHIQSKLNKKILTENHSMEINNDLLAHQIWNDHCFVSHHLSKTILNHLEDVWGLLNRDTLPQWVIQWPQKYSFIFSYEMRVDILYSYWFGSSRSVHWLQQRTKSNVDYVRPALRDDFPSPYYFLGRLKKHIANVPRPFNFGNTNVADIEARSMFWLSVKDLFKFHSRNKEELEIQFQNEVGTGLGPTLEFMNILSMEFMRIDNHMWIHSDTIAGDSEKYIFEENGLFPYPWSLKRLNSDILERFHVLGIFIAKCLQDNRRIDINFSEAFLKLLSNDIPDYNLESYLEEFISVYPMRGQFLKVLSKYCYEKERILSDNNENASLNIDHRLKMISIEILGTTFDELCLDMEFLPTSKEYCVEPFLLPIPNIDDGNIEKIIFGEHVTEYNAEIYLKETLYFTMNQGIKQQILAMKDGFNEVFPIRSLAMFTALELKQLLCGEQDIKWTLEELYQFTEPTQGYTKQSQNYHNFLEVLEEMTQTERKRFIKFLTGCTSLPPGGLKNLKPRLTIVKKNMKDGGPYPSVNTCMHYLKLPEYETKTDLKTKLMDASSQHGFHLN